VNSLLDSKIYIARLFIVTLMLFLAGCGFGARDSFNAATTNVSMIIYFTPEATYEEIIKFEEEVLLVPRPDGSFDLASGIYARSACQSPPGYAIAMCLEISDKEYRVPIRQAAEEWDIVQKVLEDVVPMQVTEADILD
jgi:hypothetical protein